MKGVVTIGAVLSLSFFMLCAGVAGLHIHSGMNRTESLRSRLPVRSSMVKRVMKYHGVNAARIEPDGTIYFRRDGRWIENHYTP